jgi:hypothetical protein
MTAFALEMTRDRFTVCADSLGYTINGGKPLTVAMQKVIPLPALRAVIYSRGMFQITVHVAAELMMRYDIQDIEHAAEILPELLSTATERVCALHDIETDPAELMMLEFTLAGWSERDRRVKWWDFNNYEGYAASEPLVTDTRRIWGSPSLPAEYKPTVPAGMAPERQLVEVMKAQRRHFAENPAMAGAIIGGEVHATTVTEAGISHRVLYRFPDYAAMKTACAAVAARLYRGDDPEALDIEAGMTPVADGVDPAAEGETAIDRAERRRAERAAKRLAHAGRAA